MGLDTKEQNLLKKGVLAVLIFITGVLAIDLLSSISLNREVILTLLSTAICGSALAITSLHLWKKDLYLPMAISALVVIGLGTLGTTIESSFTIPYLLLSLITSATGLLIITGLLREIYQNDKSSLVNPREFKYSITSGFLSLVIGLSTYITSYKQDYILTSLLSVKFISGLIGSFLLASAPVYLYLTRDKKIPALGSLIWITWGLFGFIQNLNSYPIDPYFPPREFILPNNGAYFFSGMMFVSILIIYEHLRQAKKE